MFSFSIDMGNKINGHHSILEILFPLVAKWNILQNVTLIFIDNLLDHFHNPLEIIERAKRALSKSCQLRFLVYLFIANVYVYIFIAIKFVFHTTNFSVYLIVYWWHAQIAQTFFFTRMCTYKCQLSNNWGPLTPVSVYPIIVRVKESLSGTKAINNYDGQTIFR